MKSIKKMIRTMLNDAGYDIVTFKKPEPTRYRWDDYPEFMEILAKIRPVTLVSEDRLFYIYQLAKQARTLAGDVAEVGVYKGGTAWMLGKVFSGTPKQIHLFDTFEGLPEANPTKDNVTAAQAESFRDTSEESVRTFLDAYPNVQTHKGFFPATAGSVADNRFCFAYLDADLYQSIKDGLEFFYARMPSGGVLICDDYRSPKFPGVDKAVQEFLADKSEVALHTAWHQCAIVKL